MDLPMRPWITSRYRLQYFILSPEQMPYQEKLEIPVPSSSSKLNIITFPAWSMLWIADLTKDFTAVAARSQFFKTSTKHCEFVIKRPIHCLKMLRFLIKHPYLYHQQRESKWLWRPTWLFIQFPLPDLTLIPVTCLVISTQCQYFCRLDLLFIVRNTKWWLKNCGRDSPFSLVWCH